LRKIGQYKNARLLYYILSGILCITADILILLIVGAASTKEAVTVGDNAP